MRPHASPRVPLVPEPLRRRAAWAGDEFWMLDRLSREPQLLCSVSYLFVEFHNLPGRRSSARRPAPRAPRAAHRPAPRPLPAARASPAPLARTRQSLARQGQTMRSESPYGDATRGRRELEDLKKYLCHDPLQPSFSHYAACERNAVEVSEFCLGDVQRLRIVRAAPQAAGAAGQKGQATAAGRDTSWKEGPSSGHGCRPTGRGRGCGRDTQTQVVQFSLSFRCM